MLLYTYTTLNLFLIFLKNESEKIPVEATPMQITNLLYYSTIKNLDNFYRTPYDYFLDFINLIGGNIQNIIVTERKNSILWGYLVLKINNETFGIEMPAGDLLIYSYILNKKIKILNKIL
jgi:hypothetical protein